jgi:exopolysaccharide biosynthesis protein
MVHIGKNFIIYLVSSCLFLKIIKLDYTKKESTKKETIAALELLVRFRVQE